jgi:uncharacterized membrane protein (UPF0136 family)
MGVAVLLLGYGALMGLGGVMGYRRSDSKISLVVGGFFGILLILCGALAWAGYQAPAYIGFALSILMMLLFSVRYRRTKKFRPAGLMAVVSLIVVVTAGYLLFV